MKQRIQCEERRGGEGKEGMDGFAHPPNPSETAFAHLTSGRKSRPPAHGKKKVQTAIFRVGTFLFFFERMHVTQANTGLSACSFMGHRGATVALSFDSPRNLCCSS